METDENVSVVEEIKEVPLITERNIKLSTIEFDVNSYKENKDGIMDMLSKYIDLNINMINCDSTVKSPNFKVFFDIKFDYTK